MGFLCRLGHHSWRRGSAVLNGWMAVWFPVRTCTRSGERRSP